MHNQSYLFKYRQSPIQFLLASSDYLKGKILEWQYLSIKVKLVNLQHAYMEDQVQFLQK